MNALIAAKNYTEIGNIFTRALPDGSAVEFLEAVIESINGGPVHKKAKSASSEIPTAVSKEVNMSYIANDAIDEAMITAAFQISDDMNLIAYIIGAKGVNVMNIGKASSSKIQVEKTGTRGADQYRHIFVMGTLKNVLKTYQGLNEHILKKDPSFPEITRMIVPNEVVAHIIGKGGVLIKELSSIANIQRIDIQQETELSRMTSGYYGRTVTVSGDFSKRLHVVYLLLRQLIQDNSLPAVWKGESLPVLYPQGWSGPNMGQNLGGNMFPNHLGQNGMGSGLGGGYGSQGLPGQGLFYPPQGPRGMGSIAPRGPSFANTIKVDVQIPSDKGCLGHIIGPKGSFIVEMERTSQCTIKIDKDHVEGTNPAERRVSVSGSNMVQISQAIELVNKKVEDWRRSYTPGGAVSYRAPDDPKPYWDVPKATMGFSSYPAQPQQPQYSIGGTGGQSLYTPNQGSAMPGLGQGPPYYQAH